ncbi:MAG: hypothetical protein AB1772_05810 [Candidatus Zixiibacteriota bacterium]
MKQVKASIVFSILAGLAALLFWLGSCAKKMEGSVYANEKPIVWFVNVPPENARSSVNPIVNWYGQDRDGQIDFYRYMVVREDVMGDSLGKPSDWDPTEPGQELTPGEIQQFMSRYLMNMHDSLWTKLLVRADYTDPHTSNIIPMSAQMDNPVLVYVPQFVFVQAFDEEGLGSDVVYRRFLRNDNPPATRIVGFIDGVPFINSVLPTGEATGIRIRWQGTDVLDYPTDPPPFEFEWKLFGPYSNAEYTGLLDSFLAKVFITTDARVFRFGLPPQTYYDTFWNPDNPGQIDSIDTIVLGTALIVCDTTYENGQEVETCDTILIDTLKGNNIYGNMDTLLRVYDNDFISSPLYRVADSSHDEFGNVWTTETRDSIYDVYRNYPSDTTQAAKFLFVVRCRDDALVPDLTPAWRGFTVINPRHERDILVVDFQASAAENNARLTSTLAFWQEAVDSFKVQTGHDTLDFVTGQDFHNHGDYGGSYPREFLADLLRYKLIVVFQDAEVSGTWSNQGQKYRDVLTALQTGMRVWVTARVPFGNFPTGSPYREVPANSQYQFYFGVLQYTFPGWSSPFYRDSTNFGCPRTEDFIGTLSLDEDRWPELAVDTSLLRIRYRWQGRNCFNPPTQFPFQPYMANLGSIPQVGWVVRSFDSEVMYLYRSLYGNEHALDRKLSFQGRPVGIRLNRGLFRTVHFNFTPLALKRATMQPMVNDVLSWLYDSWKDLEVAKKSGQEAALAEELGNRYWECYWKADGDKEKFYELLENAY